MTVDDLMAIYVWVAENLPDEQDKLTCFDEREGIMYLRKGEACPFFDGGCTIEPVKPVQCRAYPFWPELVNTRWDWRCESKECPGIDKGRSHSTEEILDILKSLDRRM